MQAARGGETTPTNCGKRYTRRVAPMSGGVTPDPAATTANFVHSSSSSPPAALLLPAAAGCTGASPPERARCCRLTRSGPSCGPPRRPAAKVISARDRRSAVHRRRRLRMQQKQSNPGRGRRGAGAPPPPPRARSPWASGSCTGVCGGEAQGTLESNWSQTPRTSRRRGIVPPSGPQREAAGNAVPLRRAMPWGESAHLNAT